MQVHFASRLAVLVVSFSLAACATYDRTKPAPAVSGPIAVNVSTEEISGWTDLPIGAYKVPDSNVVITGHQTGQAAGALFGLIGVAIAHAANSNSSAAGVDNAESALRIKMSDRTREEIDALIAKEPLIGKFTMEAGAARLDVITAVLLSYVKPTEVRPYVILKVALVGPDKRPLWDTRYFASTGQARPMQGADSWTADGGESLKAVLNASLRQAVKVMLNDIARPYARDENNMIVVEGDFPFLTTRAQLRGYGLTEDDLYIVFSPKIGDVVTFSGVSVMDKSVVVFRPAKADDVVFKAVETPSASPVAGAAPAGTAVPTGTAATAAQPGTANTK